LVQAAEWANAQSIAHLDGITDTATLFLLSAVGASLASDPL
jgi:hypothetical protein